MSRDGFGLSQGRDGTSDPRDCPRFREGVKQIQVICINLLLLFNLSFVSAVGLTSAIPFAWVECLFARKYTPHSTRLYQTPYCRQVLLYFYLSPPTGRYLLITEPFTVN